MKLLTVAIAWLCPCLVAAQGTRSVASTAGSYTGASTSPSPNSSATSAEATKTAIAPVLDGKLDDVAWKSAQVIDKFLEYEPKAGAETRFRTDVRVVHDDRYLYIMARMFDPAPDSIIALLSRRDVRTNSEQLKLVIDSYHDRRTAYQFITNPAGVKRDAYVSNDTNEDGSWDAVWDVATAIDSLGWTAESGRRADRWTATGQTSSVSAAT